MRTPILLAGAGVALCVVSIMLYTGEENPELKSFRLAVSNQLLSIGLALIFIACFIAFVR